MQNRLVQQIQQQQQQLSSDSRHALCDQLLNAASAMSATPSPPMRPFRYTFLFTCGNHQQ
jgi:hypothetical protein